MAWEDEELAAYERKRTEANERNLLSVQRNRMLEEQHEKQWIALRTEILETFQLLNEKAGRIITQSRTHQVYELRIQREDREELQAEYDAETRAVTFTSESNSFDEISFGLTVHPVQGNDRLVWSTIGKNSEDLSKEQVSKNIVSKFLRVATF